MAILITEGTKEYLPITVVDDLGTLSTVSTPLYDVQYDDNSFLYTAAAGIAAGMIVSCMLDLSATGPDGLIPAGERLRLFLKFADAPQLPRLGPVVLRVINEGL